MASRFRELLRRALEGMPAGDRVVLETRGGATACFLSDPEDALVVAEALRRQGRDGSAPSPLHVRIGLHLGPVRMIADSSGAERLLGDGVEGAERLRALAEPNQLLASRPYGDVVSRLAPHWAPALGPVRLHRDDHGRDYAVYDVSAGPEPGAATAAAGTSGVERVGPPGPPFDPELIDRLAAALAREIGPAATLILRRAAERASDERALGDILAQLVPEGGRAAFLAGLADYLSAAPISPPIAEGGPPDAEAAGEVDGSAQPAAPEPSPDEAPEPSPLTPEVLARAERLLTRQLGPVARLLVTQAAKKAGSARELFERLAVHIDDANRRRVFIAEAERG